MNKKILINVIGNKEDEISNAKIPRYFPSGAKP